MVKAAKPAILLRNAGREQPSLDFESCLWSAGLRLVAGVDEVGIGPLAGPVVAAAVVFAPAIEIAGVRDSKLLGAQARAQLFGEIIGRAVAVGVGSADPEEIDRRNVYQAALAASARAVRELGLVPQHLLVDGRAIPGLAVEQTALVGGDRRCFTIAAASIVAKVLRDRLMEGYERALPGYGFARHKGYGTPEHLAALRRLGPSPLHRYSYAPVQAVARRRR